MSVQSSPAQDDPPDSKRAGSLCACHNTLLHVVVVTVNKLSRDANSRALVHVSELDLRFSAAGLGSLSPSLDRLGLANIIFSGEINTLLDGKARLDVEQTIIHGTDIILATEALRSFTSWQERSYWPAAARWIVELFQGVRSEVAKGPVPGWLRFG